MRIKALSIGITILLLTGCSNQNRDLELTLATVKDDNVVLTSELEQLKTQNKELLEQIDYNKAMVEETNTKCSKELLDISIVNQDLILKLQSSEEELADSKSWRSMSDFDSAPIPIKDEQIINLLDKIIGEDIPPIYGVVFCDTYINHIQNVENRNLMIFKLHETLVNWEDKYKIGVKNIIDETVSGDYQVRMRAEWTAISRVESELNELEKIEPVALRDLLIEAKYSGYTAESDEEVVGFEHDRSFLISKYGDLLTEDLLLYLELEDLINRYGTWHSEEASNKQLDLIKIIKENHQNSNYRLMSPDELNEYEEELKYQLDNINHWGTYGFIDQKIIVDI